MLATWQAKSGEFFVCHVASQEWRVFVTVFGTWEKKKRK